jgi:threonine dehydrogenase-like Zn-dependent dehydrogenase
MRGLRVLNTAPGIATDHNVNNMQRAVRLIDKGTFDLARLVTHRYSFDNAAEALRQTCDRPDGFIKGVLTFGAAPDEEGVA